MIYHSSEGINQQPMDIIRSIAATLAALPIYGYFVHAARDTQFIGLLIILSWSLTFVFVIGAFMTILIKRSSIRWERGGHYYAIYLFVATIVGYGGARHAFFELLAG